MMRISRDFKSSSYGKSMWCCWFPLFVIMLFDFVARERVPVKFGAPKWNSVLGEGSGLEQQGSGARTAMEEELWTWQELRPWPWPLSSSGLELDFEDGDGEEGCSGAEWALSSVGFRPDNTALRRTVALRFHKVPERLCLWERETYSLRVTSLLWRAGSLSRVCEAKEGLGLFFSAVVRGKILPLQPTL
jgi:hypothetical protein